MRASIAKDTWLEYDDAGSGPVVVLLHGFPLARAMWRPQVEALRGSFRVIAPDLRGFGGTSPFTGTPSVEQMADDVAALLDALKVTEPVTVGGLSMGGYVALAFARRHPARLARLILADTRAEPDTAEAKANRDKMIATLQARPVADVFESMLPKLVGDATRSAKPEVVDELRRIAAAQTPKGAAAAVLALRDRPDAGPSLGSIKVPTLVIVGADDALTPPSAAETLANGIAGARLEKIAGAGHMANLEQPEAFNAALLSFLTRK